MAELKYTIPTIGFADKTQDPLIVEALTKIKEVINGKLGEINFEAASMGEATLSSRVKSLLNAKTMGLAIKSGSVETNLESGEIFVATSGCSKVNLPTATANRVIGISI